MPTWIVSMVVGFVIRQVSKYGESLDWTKVKADVDAQVRAYLPDWFEGAVVEIVDKAMDICKAALADAADLKAVAEKFVAGDVAGGLAALKEMLVKLVHPDVMIKGHLVAAVEAMEAAQSQKAA